MTAYQDVHGRAKFSLQRKAVTKNHFSVEIIPNKLEQEATMTNDACYFAKEDEL
jgi:hypothetical protein